jgi:hypothetical protein
MLREIKSLEAQTFPQVLHSMKSLHLEGFDHSQHLVDLKLRWMYTSILISTMPTHQTTLDSKFGGRR